MTTEGTPSAEELYADAMEEYGRVKERLETALRAMQKKNKFPSPPPSVRWPLPEERPACTHRAEITTIKKEQLVLYITPGTYSDGRVGELFVTAEKQGSFIAGLLSAFAIVVSIALQHGVPLERIVDKLRFTIYPPNGLTTHPKIGRTTSVVDYIVRWLAHHFEPSILAGPEKRNEDLYE